EEELSCPDDVDEWFKKIFDVVNQPSLGDPFRRLLCAWLRVEAKHSFDINKGASLTVPGAPPKPAALSAWINAGRRAKKPIHISNVPSFDREMWDWWIGLQPEWRRMDKAGYPIPGTEVEGEWGVLEVHGQNGMASAVACLCWWGLSLGKRSDASWQRCVADVAWVCERLADA
ncbi:hypothetical protein K523DRAFT_257842, partial [Schizophyllum commune Tattone D]